MDPHLVRQWKAGHEEINRLVEAGRRVNTPPKRLRELVAIWRRARLLGFSESKPFDAALADRWQRLRSGYARKHG